MASLEPFIGEVAIFAAFVPKGWLPCDGSVLPIKAHTALFSVIGNAYGGDGHTTFALPKLRDAVPMGMGAGPGLSPIAAGQKSGSDSVTLTNDQTAHSHALSRKGAASIAQKTNSTGGSTNLGQLARQWDVPGNQWELVPHFRSGATPDTSLHPSSISQTGGGQPHENRQPYLGLVFGIAVDGLFPPRP